VAPAHPLVEDLDVGQYVATHDRERAGQRPGSGPRHSTVHLQA
jgi:hypothetical protein